VSFPWQKHLAHALLQDELLAIAYLQITVCSSFIYTFYISLPFSLTSQDLPAPLSLLGVLIDLYLPERRTNNYICILQ